jgi:hypothetical protein
MLSNQTMFLRDDTNHLKLKTSFCYSCVSASTPKTSSVTVYVSVYGPSESPIVFNKPKYTANLAENAAQNVKVLKVAATKSGSSSGITYELVGGHTTVSGVPVFTIDSSGQVFLAVALDREDTSSYKLFIRAKHTGGSIELATDVEGIVTITDINDNAPKFAFEGSSKVVTIENYTPIGTVTIRVSMWAPCGIRAVHCICCKFS